MINTDTDLNSLLGITNPDAVDKNNNDFGQEQFLTLMLAQLQNQSPLEPIKNGEFLTQMAQFSSAAGMADLNKSFESVANTLQSNQALQASSLVGRSVLISSDKGRLSPGESLSGVIDLPSSTGNVTVTIRGLNGELLRSLELGSQSAGEINFSWDGIGDDGSSKPVGDYLITAEAEFDGETYSLETFVKSSVESVTIGQGGQGLILNITDLGSVTLDQIRKIL